ncbi:MAG TPA: 50S ribosomal protein L35 [Patescibacteria group bacterium]|nr:50S ribosomal protein L35 [Patescibacteria group bacterium]
MPKLKSRNSITTRLKITKNGKILRRQSFRRHLKAAKSSKRLGNLSRTIELTGFYAKKVHKATGTIAKQPKRTRKAKVQK